MKVKVRYFAYIRQLVQDTREEEFSLPDRATLRDLLMKIVKKYGRSIEKVLFDSMQKKALSENIIVLVNGKAVNDLKLELEDEDTISIMPFLSGG
ncbi:MAG: MoaD/ThiS family protein [Candidatus Njordarchaeales archaeon]